MMLNLKSPEEFKEFCFTHFQFLEQTHGFVPTNPSQSEPFAIAYIKTPFRYEIRGTAFGLAATGEIGLQLIPNGTIDFFSVQEAVQTASSLGYIAELSIESKLIDQASWLLHVASLIAVLTPILPSYSDTLFDNMRKNKMKGWMDWLDANHNSFPKFIKHLEEDPTMAYYVEAWHLNRKQRPQCRDQ
jgi:hypothetical protein